MIKIEPKRKDSVLFKTKISKKAMMVLNEYSEHTNYEMYDLMDLICDEILQDADFIKYLRNKRDNKRILNVIFNESAAFSKVELVLKNSDIPFTVEKED